MSRRRGACLTALLTGLLVSPGHLLAAPATAQDRSVAVLPLNADEGVPLAMAQEIQRAIDVEVTGGLASAKRSSAVEASLSGCADTTCFVEAAAELGVTDLVVTQVRSDGRDLTIEVRLIAGADGSVLATAREVCEVCGLSETRELAAQVAVAVRRKFESVTTPATLFIESDPSDAVVIIDGKVVGATPLEIEVDIGERKIELRKDGYVVVNKQVEFVDGVRESLSLPLVLLPELPSEDAAALPSSRKRRAIGWSLFASGLGGLVAGTTLIAFDHQPIESQCSGENIDAMGECRYRYRSFEAGLALAVVGIALNVTGAVLLARPAKKRRVSLAPTATGAVLSGQF